MHAQIATYTVMVYSGVMEVVPWDSSMWWLYNNITSRMQGFVGGEREVYFVFVLNGCTFYFQEHTWTRVQLKSGFS